MKKALKAIPCYHVEEDKKCKRIEWIDQTRGVLFFFVILCHSCLAVDWLKYLYEPIFLTGFFFLSGYLYKRKEIFEQLRSVFNGLFMPFLIYSVLWGFIGCVQNHSFDKGLNLALVTLAGGDNIWFIPCLIWVELIYIVTDYLTCRYVDIILIAFSCVAFFIVVLSRADNGIWCWTVALYAVGFFAFGDVCKQRLLGRNKAIACMGVYVIGCLVLGCTGCLNQIDLHLNQYGSAPWAFLLAATGGCVTFVSVMKYVPVSKYLMEFGNYTLFLFPFHGLVLRQFMKVFGVVGGFFFSSILILLATFITCLLLGRVTYKYLPALGGKKKWL